MRTPRAPLVATSRGPVECAVRGEGPPLLVVHGQPGGFDQGLGIVRDIGAWRRVISPSRPGYLGTPLGSGPGLVDQADLMAALLDALEVASVAVVALSAGAAVALELAIRHPGRVAALVLLAGVTGPDASSHALLERAALSAPAAALARLGARVTPRLLAFVALAVEGGLGPAEAWRAAAASVSDPSRLRDAVRGVAPFRPRRAGDANDRRLVAGMDVPPLERVRAPTLVVHGDRDREVDPSHPRRALERIPHAEPLWLSCGTHLITLAPGWPAAAGRIRGFLARHAGPVGAAPSSPPAA